MAATYVNVTQAEMEALLLPQGFKKLELPGTRELVYGRRLDGPHQVTLRVYTGIEPDGDSRDVGADAIRCNLFVRRADGEVRQLIGSKRVHRVAGWRANLQQRLDSLDVEKICPACGAPMALRKGKTGSFYGCVEYPACRRTEPAVS